MTNHPGPRLRQRRLALGIGLRQLARHIKLDKAHLSRIERELIPPRPRTVKRINDGLDSLERQNGGQP